MPKVSSEGLAVGLLAIAAAVLACLAPAQSDTWWLLRAGQDIAATLAIPLVDSYSWTADGLFWPNHEWSTEVVFFLLYSAGGMPAVAVLSAGMIMTGLVLAWRLAEGPFEPRFVAFGAALVASAAAFAIRPQVFTIAAFALTCVLLRRDRLWWIPPTIVVWVNFHGAAVLGVIAVAAALVSDVVSMRKHDVHGGHGEHGEHGGNWGKLEAHGGHGGRILRSLAVAVLAVLATLASPLGTRLWSFIPESTARSRINQLIEWSAPDFSAGHLPFWAAATALVVLTFLGWRRLDRNRRRLVAVALAVLPLAVQSMRNVHIFLLAAVPALTMLVAALRAERPSSLSRGTSRGEGRPRRGENEGLNGALLTGIGALAAVAVAAVWLHPPAMLKWQPVSEAAARAIAACGSPMYNTYGQGGELIWFVPGQRVFIDNRQDPYPMDVLRANRQLERDGSYEAVFAAYGVRCAVVPPASIIASRLRMDSAWSAGYADDAWAVFLKR